MHNKGGVMQQQQKMKRKQTKAITAPQKAITA
jgi:hypothetical protein